MKSLVHTFIKVFLRIGPMNYSTYLATEAARLLDEYRTAESAVGRKFYETAKKEFPQLNLIVIFKGLSPGHISTIHEPLADRTLINLGVYTASALLDPRAKINMRNYKSLSGEKIDTPILTDLFPWLKDGSKESTEILEIINKFSDFRFNQLEEPTNKVREVYGNIKSKLKKKNPGYLEEAYDKAVNMAWRG